MQTLISVITVAVLGVAGAVSISPILGGGGPGHGAPAPEIGAGLIGIALAVSAVKYFRRRRQG